MATFFCTNCGERMCNSSNDNLFENVYKIDDSWREKANNVYKKIFLFIAEPLNDKLKIQEREVEKAEWTPINKAGDFLSGYYKDVWGELLNRIES